jgi:diguanylate cyclase (GGDEF)-like protein
MENLKSLFRKATGLKAADSEEVRRERMVRFVLWLISITLIPLTIMVSISYLANIFVAQPMIMVLSMDAAMGVCWYLVGRSAWKTAGGLTAFSFFLLAAYGSYINGLTTTLVLTYAIVILLVSMFYGGKACWYVLLACIFSHCLLGAIHDQKPINQMLVSMTVTAFCLTGVTLLQWFATRLLKSALAEAHQVEERLLNEISERKEMELRLHYLGMHDAMTGLYNRSFFEAELERLQHSRLYPISILMSDLDGLKRVNDQFGHAFGDDLIKRTAGILKDTFRAEDVVARLGGDEFAVLFASTDPACLQVAVQRLKYNLAEYNRQAGEMVVELSIGAATAEKGMLLSGAMKQADDRMYEEKIARRLKAQQAAAAVLPH